MELFYKKDFNFSAVLPVYRKKSDKVNKTYGRQKKKN